MRNFIRYFAFPAGLLLVALEALVLLGRLPENFWSLTWTGKKAALKLIWPAATTPTAPAAATPPATMTDPPPTT